MTDPIAKWKAKIDLRDEMIAVMGGLTWAEGPSPLNVYDDAPEIADAILEILARWDAGSLPDE